MKATYTPINCSYYDRLEAWATLRETCSIIWSDQDGITRQVNSKINDLLLNDGVEYLVGENHLHIRLDQLIYVNGIPLPGGSCVI
jgi:Rho-binding antiterminator